MMGDVIKYGNSPHNIILVHGGPGAKGSMKPIAIELAKSCGVLESIQTKYTINELVLELHWQLQENCREKVILIGHSWGAWLVMLFSVQYPKMVKKIILIGSGPFSPTFKSQVNSTRKERFSPNDQRELAQLIIELDNGDNQALGKIGELYSRIDNYSLLPQTGGNINVDSKAFKKIWPQADKRRETGELLKKVNELSVPTVIIHGKYDPHPFEGVIQPLNELNIEKRFHIIPKCGHDPWREKYARNTFFKILLSEIL